MKLLAPVLGSPLEAACDLADRIFACEEDEQPLSGACFENEVLRELTVGALELRGCRFVGCRFAGCTFEKTDFTDAVFENCDFSNCRLDNVVLHRVEFSGCKLLGAAFEAAYLRNVRFTHSACAYLALRHSDLKSVCLSGCDLSSADIFDCKLSVSLASCNLTEARFYLTPLQSIDFTSCEIAGISVSPENLKGAIVTRDQAADLARLLGLTITG